MVIRGIVGKAEDAGPRRENATPGNVGVRVRCPRDRNGPDRKDRKLHPERGALGWQFIEYRGPDTAKDLWAARRIAWTGKYNALADPVTILARAADLEWD